MAPNHVLGVQYGFNVVGGLILSSQIMLVCIEFKISEIFCKIADMPQMLDVYPTLQMYKNDQP